MNAGSMTVKWEPDPRVCENCEGFGFIINWAEQTFEHCADCNATGYEYAT